MQQDEDKNQVQWGNPRSVHLIDRLGRPGGTGEILTSFVALYTKKRGKFLLNARVDRIYVQKKRMPYIQIKRVGESLY